MELYFELAQAMVQRGTCPELEGCIETLKLLSEQQIRLLAHWFNVEAPPFDFHKFIKESGND